MELAFELPTAHLGDLGKHNEYNFTLAHLALQDPTYLKYYRNSDKYTICDNSNFELLTSVSHDDIIEAAHRLKAQEIIAPDSLRSGRHTIESTADFIEHLKKRGEIDNFKIMGVVQGANVPDWSLCIDFLQKHPNITTIGASYIGCSSFAEDPCNARIGAITLASQIGGIKKPFHLLGVGGNPKELEMHSASTNIRSCDTSMPIVQGMSYNCFDKDKGLIGPKLPRPDDYFDCSLNSKQIADIEMNISILRDWASNPVNA